MSRNCLSHTKLCRVCVVVAAAVLLPIPSFAQQAPKPKPEISFGVVVPIAINTTLHPPAYIGGEGTTGGRPGGAVGLWGEAAVFASPRIAFHTGIDLPRSYQDHYMTGTSSSFESTIHRRDVVVYELVGFHPDSGRTKPTWVVGGGVAWRKSHADVTYLDLITGAPTQQGSFKTTQVDLTFVGGGDFPIEIGRKTRLVVRLRGNVTVRRQDSLVYGDTPGWLGLSPGVGFAASRPDTSTRKSGKIAFRLSWSR